MRMKVSAGTRPVTEPELAELWRVALYCEPQETATFSFPEEGKKTTQSGRTLDF